MIKKILFAILGIFSFILMGAVSHWNKTGKMGKVSSIVLSLVFLIFGLSNFYITIPEDTISAADTSYKFPTATGETFNEWTDPTNAYADDEQQASGDNATQDYYDFDFSVPAGSIIDGVELDGEGGTRDIMDASATFYISCDGGSNYSAGKNVSFTRNITTPFTLGGSADLWGLTLSSSSFSNSNFRLKGYLSNTIMSPVDIQYLKIKVFYTESEGERRIITIE